MPSGLRRRILAVDTMPESSEHGRIRSGYAAVRHTADNGFTIVEVLVATALIGVVMTAFSSFFISTLSITNHQSSKQLGIQVASSATEYVRTLDGSTLANKRDQATTNTQWAAPVPGVGPYLTAMEKVWDLGASAGSGATAPLPTVPKPVVVSGITFDQNFYLGTCWQAASGGDCGQTPGAGYVEFFRVVIGITWPHKSCTAGRCSYVTATLVSNRSVEPVFNSNESAQPPQVTNPGNQIGQVNQPIANLRLVATGGAPPVTFSATGTPPGITVASDGLVSGTPTVAGSYNVIVSAIDGLNLTGTAAFTWTVDDVLQVTSPGKQTTPVGAAVSLTIPRAGGTAPLAWTATELPSGLSIHPTTGVVSGAATAVGSKNVTVTARDAFNRSVTINFQWETTPRLQVVTPPSQAGARSVPVSVTLVTATGGTSPYRWTATGLPNGLQIDPQTGRIYGTPSRRSTFNVTVTVTDNSGVTAATSFNWTIS